MCAYAVRVRPFNQRELELDSPCVLEMSGQQTRITDPASGAERSFAFDHSFWSHEPGADGHVGNQQVCVFPLLS